MDDSKSGAGSPTQRSQPVGRPRETDTWSTVELVARIIWGDQYNVAAAEALIDRAGGLRALVSGLVNGGAGDCAGAATTAVQREGVLAALEFAERYWAEGVRRGYSVADPGDARCYVRARLGRYEREVFACVFLDNQHRLLAYEELFFGTIDGATVHPREVVKRALGLNAAAVILAHNHPSGVAEPSQADRRITVRLQQALGLVDVRVLDHLVVGDAEIVSLAERGLLWNEG